MDLNYSQREDLGFDPALQVLQEGLADLEEDFVVDSCQILLVEIEAGNLEGSPVEVQKEDQQAYLVDHR